MSGGADPATADDGILAAILAPLLAISHAALSCWTSFILFGFAGGVATDGRWTRYGGTDYAYTSLAWVPGGLLVAAGPTVAWAGVLLMFAGSGVAGHAAASATARLVVGPRPRFGRRTWVAAALWLVWLPVPVTGTVTYWPTVAY